MGAYTASFGGDISLGFRQQESGNSGLSGLLKNIWGESEQFVTGLGQAIGQGVSDVKRLAMEAGTLGHYEPTTHEGYKLPYTLLAMPRAFAEDIGQRWGPALDTINLMDNKSLGENLGELGHQLYEHPLSAFLDVASIGGLGAAVGKRAGLSAIKESPAALAATARTMNELGAGRYLSKLGLEGDDLARYIAEMPTTATSYHRALPTAVREGLKVLEKERGLSWAESLGKLLPEMGTRLRGSAPVVKGASEMGMPVVGELIPYAKSANPVTRPLHDLIHNAFTMSTTTYGKRVMQLERNIFDATEAGSAPDPRALVDLARAREVFEQATDLGIRLERPALAKNKLFRVASDFYSGTSSWHLMRRQQEMERVINVIRPWTEQLGEKNMRQVAWAILNRLEKKLPGSERIPEGLANSQVKWPEAAASTLVDEFAPDEWYQHFPERRKDPVQRTMDYLNLIEERDAARRLAQEGKLNQIGINRLSDIEDELANGWQYKGLPDNPTGEQLVAHFKRQEKLWVDENEIRAMMEKAENLAVRARSGPSRVGDFVKQISVLMREIDKLGNREAGKIGYANEIITRMRRRLREYREMYEKHNDPIFGEELDGAQDPKLLEQVDAIVDELTKRMEGRTRIQSNATMNNFRWLMQGMAQDDVDMMLKALDNIEQSIDSGTELPPHAIPGAPKRLLHGSPRVFDQFDEKYFDNESLFGPGVYGTDAGRLGSSYTKKGSKNFIDPRIMKTPEEAERYAQILGDENPHLTASVETRYLQIDDPNLEGLYVDAPDGSVYQLSQARGKQILNQEEYDALPDSRVFRGDRYMAGKSDFEPRYQVRMTSPRNVRGVYMDIKNAFFADKPLTEETLSKLDEAMRDWIDQHVSGGVVDGLDVNPDAAIEEWDQIMQQIRHRFPGDEATGEPPGLPNGEVLYDNMVNFVDSWMDRKSWNRTEFVATYDTWFQKIEEVLRQHGVPDERIQELQQTWEVMRDESDRYLFDADVDEPPSFPPNEVMNMDLTSFMDDELARALEDVGIPASGSSDQVWDQLWREVNMDLQEDHPKVITRDLLESAGFDGINYDGGRRIGTMGEHDVWVAFHPEQTRSGLAMPLEIGAPPEPEAWYMRVADPVLHERGEFLPVVRGGGKPFLEAIPEEMRAALKDNPMLMQVDSLVGELSALAEEGRLSPRDIELLPRAFDMVNRMAERAYRFQQGDKTLGIENQFLDDMRLQVTIQDALDAVDTGQMTLEQMLERPYRALRMKYGAKATRHKVDDGNGKYHYEVTYDGGPSWEELDDAFRESGEAPPVYFPFISNQRKKLSDYFRATRNVGYEDISADPHYKFMEGTLLRKGEFIRDPEEVYARRAARGVRAEETLNTMNKMIRTFGRPITKVDDLGTNEVLVAPRYMFMRHNVQRLFEDGVDELIEAGVEPQDAVPRVLTQVISDIQDEIMDMAGDTADIEMYAVPRVVVDRLTDAQRFAGFGGKWAGFVDAPMRLWRNVVLLGRPAWVLNNLLGNVLFAKMQGASLTDAMRLLENRYARLLNERFGTKFGTKFLDQLERLPGEGNVGTGYFSTLGQFEPRNPIFEQSALGRAVRDASSNKATKWLNRYGDFVKMVNRELEASFRDASYLTALEKTQAMSATKNVFRSFMRSRKRLDDLLEGGIGLGTNEVPGAAAKLALSEVDNFFGNYTRLSPFERHVVRRFIFPWWGFYRHQLRLLLSFPMNYPGRARIMQTAALASLDMMQAYGPVPEWLEGAVPIGPPGMAGPTSFLSTRGANPFEGSFSPWTSQLNPLLKVAMEQSTGRNAFTQEEFTDPSVFTPFGGDPQRIIYDENGFPTDVVPAEHVAPGFVEHLLQQIPQYQMAKQWAAGGRTYDTSTLLDALMGRLSGGPTGARTDEYGQTLFPATFMDQVAKLLGFSTVDYDLQNYQAQLYEQQQQALKEAMARVGI